MDKYEIGKQFFDEAVQLSKDTRITLYTSMSIVLERWRVNQKANEEAQKALTEDGLRLYGFSEQGTPVIDSTEDLTKHQRRNRFEAGG